MTDIVVLILASCAGLLIIASHIKFDDSDDNG